MTGHGGAVPAAQEAVRLLLEAAEVQAGAGRRHLAASHRARAAALLDQTNPHR